MPNIGPRIRLSTAESDWSGRRRSSYGLSMVKIRPLLGAAPLKLNPITEKALRMSGSA